MLIPCPHCGPRDLIEFSVLGAAVARPVTEEELDADSTRTAFAEAVYLRENPRGPQRELWYHGIGCQSWLLVTRDTGSHAILGVELAREVAA